MQKSRKIEDIELDIKGVQSKLDAMHHGEPKLFDLERHAFQTGNWGPYLRAVESRRTRSGKRS